jgi:hypothetical protein
VARPEGTVDVPRRHRDVTLSRLVLVLLLWLAWRHGIVFDIAGVIGVSVVVVVVGGCGDAAP